MEAFTAVTSRVHPLLWDDVDTDQIIPARYLKVTGRSGLAAALFADRPEALEGATEARILLTGKNFGCGSSREHAAWSLLEHGFVAVIARSFADIFRANALSNGLLPVALSGPDHRMLVELVASLPTALITVDLHQQRVIVPGGEHLPFPIEPFSKCCLLAGTDELGYLTMMSDRISAYENRRNA